MITTIGATTVAALALGASYIGGGLLTEDASDPAVVEPAFTLENPPGADDFMLSAPVTVESCGTQIVAEGSFFMEDVDDAPPRSIAVGATEISTWDSSGSLYGEDEPRLAGTATRVRNTSSGTVDGMRFADLELSGFTVVNDGGSWEGTSTSFVRSRDPGRSSEVLTLTGRGGYEGLTAVLQFPEIDEELGEYPDCFELYGIIVDGGVLPAPAPIDAVAAGLEPLGVESQIGTIIGFDGFMPFEETGFALAPGTWQVTIENWDETERGFAIEDPSGKVVAGGPNEVIGPNGGMRTFELVIEGTGEGYVMYDPSDRTGTEATIPVQE